MNIGKMNVNMNNQQSVPGRTVTNPGVNTRDVFTPSSKGSAPSLQNIIPRTLSSQDAGKIVTGNAADAKSILCTIHGEPQWRSAGGISSSSDLIYDPENKCLYGAIDVIEEAFDPDDPIQFLHQNYLTCFNNDGSIRWQNDGPDCEGGPVPDKNGNIYINSASTLWALTKDGDVKWHAGLTDLFSVGAQPVVSQDGTVFAVNKEDGKRGDKIKINAVQAGKVKWTYQTDYWNKKTNSMLPGKDGSLYVAATVKTSEKGFFKAPDKIENYFIGLKPNGTEKFKIPVKNWGEADKGCLAEGPDGTIYTIQEGSKLVAYSPDGKERFGTNLMGHRKNSAFPLTTAFPPAIDKEGNVYVATKGFQTNNLICFDKDGKEKWRTEVEKEFTATPHFAPGGNIIAAFQGGNLHVLDKKGAVQEKILVKSGVNNNPDDSGDEDNEPVNVLGMVCDGNQQVFVGTKNWVSCYNISVDPIGELTNKEGNVEESSKGDYCIKTEGESVTIGGVKLKKNTCSK